MRISSLSSLLEWVLNNNLSEILNYKKNIHNGIWSIQFHQNIYG